MIESEERVENYLEACTPILENHLDNMQQKCALHIWEGGGPNGQKETILCLNFLVLPKNVNFISLAVVTCNLAPDPGHPFPFLFPGVWYLWYPYSHTDFLQWCLHDVSFPTLLNLLVSLKRESLFLEAAESWILLLYSARQTWPFNWSVWITYFLCNYHVFGFKSRVLLLVCFLFVLLLFRSFPLFFKLRYSWFINTILYLFQVCNIVIQNLYRLYSI